MGSHAEASITLQTPAGVNPGDQFRFVFVTQDNEFNADSPNISVYDKFVQQQAGGATYNGVLVNWLAIGSTPTVNAIDHIGQTNTPVYLVDGTKVTTNTGLTGMWSGNLIAPINEDITGSLSATGVFTGTDPNGLADPNFPIGPEFGIGNVIVGVSFATDLTWIDFSPADSGNLRAYYGISQVLTAPQAVPEPSSILLMGAGLAAVLGCGWTRRSRDQRWQGTAVRPQDTPQ
jgi:hypothetical protein